jgi:chitin disaccharide deacetylase
MSNTMTTHSGSIPYRTEPAEDGGGALSNAVPGAMLIINADDWGRSREETDAARSCYRERRITSVSAMVFMDDSERAAQLACEDQLDVGLHLNLSESYTAAVAQPSAAAHQRIVRFMTANKYAMLLYRAGLRQDFRRVYETQFEEFVRLYGRPPSHIDGHQHRHLCTNMLVHEVIPRGQKVRRNFHFWPGEKGPLNRAYRHLVDRHLKRRYRVTDFFFALSQCSKAERFHRVLELARVASVELMTHPRNRDEFAFLTSDRFSKLLNGLRLGTYASL